MLIKDLPPEFKHMRVGKRARQRIAQALAADDTGKARKLLEKAERRRAEKRANLGRCAV